MIESITAFFAIWSIGFWFTIFVTSVVFILGCEYDSIGWSLFFSAGLMIYYWKFIAVIMTPTVLIPFILIWLGLGVLNSCWRLRQYARKMVDDYNKSQGCNGVDPRDMLRLNYNVVRITNWILFWPWNLLWKLTGNLFISIKESIIRIYQKIIDNALKGITVVKKY